MTTSPVFDGQTLTGFSGFLLATAGVLSARALAVADMPVGSLVQRVYSETGASTTGNTVMATSDAIPVNTAGDQYMSLAITPKSASHILVITISAYISVSGTKHIGSALFQDATVNALSAAAVYSSSSGLIQLMIIKHTMVAGTTSQTTFYFRAGQASSGATVTFNGEGGSRILGGVLASNISIEEIAA